MLGVVAEFQAQQSIQKGFCFTEDCDKQVKRIKISWLAGRLIK